MLRHSIFLPLLLSFMTLAPHTQTTSSPQDVPVTQAPQTPANESPASDQTRADKGDDQQKKPSKVKRKLRGAVPDCVSIIFSKCWHNDAREQEAEEKQAELRAHAAVRCKAIEEARALRTPSATTPQVPAGESSSKASQPPGSSPTSCTPEDVLEAEHDVDVGDTYFESGNYKAAEMRYRDALKALPEDPVASLHLARLLEKQGRKPEALQQYQAYLAWSPTGKEAEEANKAMSRLSATK